MRRFFGAPSEADFEDAEEQAAGVKRNDFHGPIEEALEMELLDMAWHCNYPLCPSPPGVEGMLGVAGYGRSSIHRRPNIPSASAGLGQGDERRTENATIPTPARKIPPFTASSMEPRKFFRRFTPAAGSSAPSTPASESAPKEAEKIRSSALPCVGSFLSTNPRVSCGLLRFARASVTVGVLS